ncbi:MAG: selenide, water dikinase SelD [Acidimicrobiales bacterium]
MVELTGKPRLTSYGHGGGCACKIPPGELEEALSGLVAPVIQSDYRLLVGLEDGDDAAAVAKDADEVLIATTDFFTPVVDDPYDWGRIAAANALSDIYAMGGRPIVALNLLCWPRDLLPFSLAKEVLRGGLEITRLAGCHLAGGHSVDDPEPKYGLAVTGVAKQGHMLRIDSATAGLPLSLTKPLGIGVLNTRHKATGEAFPQAVEAMTALNREAAEKALAAGAKCATDVTGFGLLGHLFKLARASNVTARVDPSAIEYLEGARESARAGFISGGTRRNLDWVDPHVTWGPQIEEIERLLLADAQTSGGLLIAGEVPGAKIIGELLPRLDSELIVG